MIKKDVTIAVLFTFMLTIAFFGILPIKSANAPYDPWLDYNEDGIINMRDIGATANAFGSSGDSTKNVTVTNIPDWNYWNMTPSYKTMSYTQHISSEGWGVNTPILCEGYSRIGIVLNPRNIVLEPGATINLTLGPISWHSDLEVVQSDTLEGFYLMMNSDGSWSTSGKVPCIETKAPRCYLMFSPSWNPPQSNFSLDLDICVYLRNE